jgi:hypothetical protein
MTAINPKALPAVRLAIGAGAWALPDVTGKVFGFAMQDNHEAVYMGRLFGVRDLVLGVGILATQGEAQALWWRLGILCDVADTAAGIMGYKAGGPKRGMLMATATAASAVYLGIAGARSVSP